MELFNEVVANIGFPIAVTGFLLFRVEKKLDQLNDTLVNIMELFGRNN
ncbi:MAG: YvrJ family protein [Firmicutes bacterium]|nr:YvrJ family protein [Bacillota bacterium]